MNVAYTICSNNYLAKAISLYQSLIKYNKDYKFIICLVDEPLQDDLYKKHTEGIEIIPFMSLNIPAFKTMINNYNIVELNTAVKPFIAEYIFEKYPLAEIVIYFDPDIILYAPLSGLEKNLAKNNIVITPHFHTPDRDKVHFSEKIVLKVGIYNLGFIAWKRSPETMEMLKWWQTRLKEECSTDFKNALFVDQIWINYVPLYFKDVYIEKNEGYNMAYWNFYERNLTESNGTYFVNKDIPLLFFHFSSFNPLKPDVIYKELGYSFESRPDLVAIYKDYASRLLANGYEYFSKLPSYYDKKVVPPKITIGKRVRNKLIRILSR